MSVALEMLAAPLAMWMAEGGICIAAIAAQLLRSASADSGLNAGVLAQPVNKMPTANDVAKIGRARRTVFKDVIQTALFPEGIRLDYADMLGLSGWPSGSWWIALSAGALAVGLG